MIIINLDSPDSFRPRTVEVVAIRGILAIGQGDCSVGYQARRPDGTWVNFLKKHNKHVAITIRKPRYGESVGHWEGGDLPGHVDSRLWISDEVAV